MNKNNNEQLLKESIQALKNEMAYPQGGWHLANVTKIKDCSIKFKLLETRAFVQEIITYLRKPDATSIIKFKLAQILNLLKSYNVNGFDQVIMEFKPQIQGAYLYMRDTPLAEPSSAMINNIFKNAIQISKPIVKQMGGRYPRIKTSTPSATIIRHITLHQKTQIEQNVKISTPPPYVE